MAKQGEDSPTHEKMRKATVSKSSEGQHHANALAVQYRDIDTLIPYVSNARTHSDEQIAQIAASIKEFGWTNPVLIDGENGIIAGHGRVQAARKLQETHIPIIELHGLSDVQKRAYILADNQIAINAGWDGNTLVSELERLQSEDFDISLAGFGDFDLSDLDFELDEQPDETYTRKIETPIYEITGEKPLINELYDEEKTKELSAEIKSADIPEDVARFLLYAAERHIVFDFANIAEYYAHSTPDIQNLMERSALVIIDFNKAIENGFVQTSKRLGDIANTDRDKDETTDYEKTEQIDVKGFQLLVRPETSDLLVVRENISGDEYRKLQLKNNDIVLDVGMNIGAFSIKALSKGVKKVIGFEPDETNYDLAVHNIALNNLSGKHLAVKAAVISNDDSSRTFYLNNKKNKGAHSLVSKRGREAVTVDAININHLIAEYKPTVLKMDTEGGEYEIITGIQNWGSLKQVIMEFHHAHLNDTKTRSKYNEILGILRKEFSTVDARNPEDIGGAWTGIIYASGRS